MKNMPVLGDIVVYTYADGTRRPAIVVNNHGNGCVNLHVFLDGENDFGLYDQQKNAYISPKRAWVTSVLPSDPVSEVELESGVASQPERWNWPRLLGAHASDILKCEIDKAPSAG